MVSWTHCFWVSSGGIGEAHPRKSVWHCKTVHLMIGKLKKEKVQSSTVFKGLPQ
jgi:hypothetical protein